MTLVEVTGKHCSFEFTGTARDPNHYSGEKPDTKVFARGEFTLPN